MTRATLALALLASVVGGCAEPAHLSYDFGRAYTSTFDAQADLTRSSVLDRRYHLAGVEAQAIRLNVRAETTEEETGESTYIIQQ
jgi:hypothetical protein